jgi:hypothetical protein
MKLFLASYHEDIYQVRHIGDLERYGNNEQERQRTQGGMPIVMKSEGKYTVHLHESPVHDPVAKEFTVIKSRP